MRRPAVGVMAAVSSNQYRTLRWATSSYRHAKVVASTAGGSHRGRSKWNGTHVESRSVRMA